MAWILTGRYHLLTLESDWRSLRSSIKIVVKVAIKCILAKLFVLLDIVRGSGLFFLNSLLYNERV